MSELVERLLPCPFCGPGNSQVDLWHDDVSKRWRVGCGRCGCSTGISPRDKTQAPAIAAWNARPSPSEDVARLEAEVAEGKARANRVAIAWSKIDDAHIIEVRELEARALSAESDVARLREALGKSADDLLVICDGSNWPEEAQSGVGYQMYTAATDQLHEIADNLRAALIGTGGGTDTNGERAAADGSKSLKCGGGE